MNADIPALYSESRKDLLSYLMHLLHCPQTAEDIAHESFAVLLRATKETVIEPPRGFLFRTAANLAIDFIRHSKVVERHAENHLILEEEPQFASPEQEVSKDEWLRLLKSVLMELPPRTRDIFILHRFHGNSYREIALNFNISESAVEKHISRGIQHYRQQLGGHFSSAYKNPLG